MVASVSTFDPVLLTLFPNKKMQAFAEKVEPALGLINVRTDFGGKERKVPLSVGLNQSHGATFSDVQGIGHENLFEEWTVTRRLYYGFVQLTRELIEASKSDKHAFVNGLKNSIDGMLESMRFELGRQFWGNYGGSLGRLTAASNVATDTVRLLDRRDTRFIKKGMRIQSSATDGKSGEVKAGYVTVESVNRTTGDITCVEASWDTGIPTAAASDYIFRAYCFGLCWHGFDDWVPATDPTVGDSHMGLDRSDMLDELSGIRVTPTATTLEGAITEILAEGYWRGADTVKYGFLHTTRWQELADELGARIVRDDSIKSKRAGIGYQSIVFTGQDGEVRIIASPNIGRDVFAAIDPDDWTSDALGTAPSLIKDPLDGKLIYRRDTSDNYEVRVGWMGEYECEKPVHQIRGDLSGI